MTEPKRILELWDSLTEAQKIALVSIAEAAAQATPLCLTKEESNALDHSRADFAAGRSMSFDDAEKATDSFLEELRKRA